MSCCKGAKIAELFSKAVATTKCFDQNLSKIKVICCGSGRMMTQFKVEEEHLNEGGTLHGGFIAHLVDAISTYALTSNEKVDTRGVSIDLAITYINAAKPGDMVTVRAVTKKLGKKIAFLEVEVRNNDKGITLATGRHTKYIGDVDKTFNDCKFNGASSLDIDKSIHNTADIKPKEIIPFLQNKPIIDSIVYDFVYKLV